MYDKGKILTGLLIFLVLLASPIWYNFALGKAGTALALKLGTEEKKCLEPTAFMISSHMTLLNTWRNAVIRDGNRIYVAGDGKQYDMSLTQTCLQKCHTSKAEFCDKCHTYAAVQPYCWDCHNAPEEKKHETQ